MYQINHFLVHFDQLNCNNKKLNGVYEHIYDNNFMNDNFGTHYVSFNYIININENNIDNNIFKSQHDDMIWLTKDELLNHTNVHKYTKNFFLDDADNVVFKA